MTPRKGKPKLREFVLVANVTTHRVFEVRQMVGKEAIRLMWDREPDQGTRYIHLREVPKKERGKRK